MRKIFYRAIPVILITFLFNTGSFSQESVNILRLKKFIANYEMVCNLAPEDTTTINQLTGQFRSLFFDDEVPVYYEPDTTQYVKMKMNEYIRTMKSFSKRYFIDKVTLYDFDITRVRNNGIINVIITKRMEYFPRNIDLDMYYIEPSVISDELYMTLFYTDAGTYKIIRIDRADHLFVDGLGSSRFIPSSIEIEPSILNHNITNDEFEKTGFNPGWAVALKVNYPLIGKGKFNFLFTPGLSIMHVNSSLEKSSFSYDIADQVDMDGDPYTLQVRSDGLEQTVRVGYFGVPIDFTGIWKFNKASLAVRAGLTFAYPISSSYTNDKVDMTLSGLYDFDGYSVELHDLPQYGFRHYSEGDFSSIIEPELAPMFMGHTALIAGFDLNSHLTLSFGPDLYFGFSDLITEHSVQALIDENGSATSPNLLNYGDKNSLFSWGLNVGLTYHLKRPNVPYVPNTKFNDIRNEMYTTAETVYCANLQTTNIKSSPFEVSFFVENDPRFPGNLKRVPYYFCGVTKSNSQKGSLKAGKTVNLSLDMPQDDRKRGDAILRIEKPYGIDIYRYDYEQNPDARFLDLSYNSMKDEKESIMLYTREIPTIDIFYVNNYYKDYEDLDRKEFIDEVRDIIAKTGTGEVHELFLYSAYNADSCAVKRTYTDDESAISDFLACCYNWYPQGWLNDVDLFKQYLNDIPCARRDVNLHIVLASPYTYIEYIKSFINTVSEYKLESNYGNVNIYIHMPLKQSHLENAGSDLKELQALKDIFDGKPKSPDIFDYEFNRLFINK